jgi:hypothetical protein
LSAALRSDLAHCRPAFVDPQAFLDPGRTAAWTARNESAYGTQGNLDLARIGLPNDYVAIVLVVKQPGDNRPVPLSASGQAG